MTRNTDDWFAEADDILDNWTGSDDSATWNADGSHEHDTGGEYYAADRPAAGFPVSFDRAPTPAGSRFWILPTGSDAPTGPLPADAIEITWRPDDERTGP